MSRLEAVLRRIARDLIDLGYAWALVGGLAVSVRTEPRFTRDVDLAVAVGTDRDAERLVRELQGRGYQVQAVVEQEATGRLATTRLVPPGEDPAGVVLDVLFASSGIESEITAAAEPLEVLPGLRAPVATVGHLIALKVLARDDRTRPQDRTDLVHLMSGAKPADMSQARDALALIRQRGYARGKDLAGEFERLLGEHPVARPRPGSRSGGANRCSGGTIPAPPHPQEAFRVQARDVSSTEVLVTRDGPIVTLTFNRPEARNAMTWNMYERLYQTCEEVDADDSIRLLVLRGAGGKAFVAGTDISQFTAFKTAEDGIKYERDGDRRSGRLARVKKPVIAQIQGYAVGGGFGIAAAADLRIATPDARFGAPIARTLGNCLSMEAYARYMDLLGPSRLKELIFTARLMSAEEARAAGFVHEIVPADHIEARVQELAETVAGHAPITLWVTKEAIRRLQAARPIPNGADLITTTYASADFHEGVGSFLEKRKPNWTGK